MTSESSTSFSVADLRTCALACLLDEAEIRADLDQLIGAYPAEIADEGTPEESLAYATSELAKADAEHVTRTRNQIVSLVYRMGKVLQGSLDVDCHDLARRLYMSDEPIPTLLAHVALHILLNLDDLAQRINALVKVEGEGA